MAAFLIALLALTPARADDASARALLARSAAAQAAGDAEKAWTLAKEASAQAPEDREARVQAASAALAARRYADAVEQATAALALAPTAAALQTRSAAYQGLGKLSLALKDAQEALKLNPSSAIGRLRLAQASEASGHAVTALENYRRAAELDRTFLPVYEQARRRLGTPAPWWPWAAGGAGLAVFAGLAALTLRKGHRSRRVRFAAVIRVPPAADEPPPGRVLGGRYIVGRAVDRGPSAQVFEGRDLEDRPLLIRRFLRGLDVARAQAAANLKHPGICGLEAAFEEDGWSLAVGETPAGKSLAETLEKTSGRRLPADRVAQGLKPLAEGLDAAHAAGLRHGHIALSEIWVEEAGWRLSGLGLPGAPAADAAPPEASAETPEGDLYALACCVYEALSGEKPFAGPEGALARTEGRPASLAGRVGLPAGLDSFFSRALQPDPARRFRSAAELLLALRSLVAPAVH